MSVIIELIGETPRPPRIGERARRRFYAVRNPRLTQASLVTTQMPRSVTTT